MKNPSLGSIEVGEDSIFHSAYPHLVINLPITPGTAYPKGTVLQVDDTTHKLEGSDLSGRVYVADEDIAEDDEDANVAALGVVLFDRLLDVNGDPLTSNDALAIMEKSPLVVI